MLKFLNKKSQYREKLVYFKIKKFKYRQKVSNFHVSNKNNLHDFK